MAEQSLKDKTVNGLSWNLLNQFATKGIVFVFSILLARVLMPEDYGLIAMLNIFIAIAQTFIDSGFSTAIIRKPDLTEDDLCTVFYFNLAISVFCYLLLFFGAPFIADFYNTPELVLVTRIISLNLIISAFNGVQSSLLKIRLDFKTPAVISIFSAVVFSALGLWMAYRGFGVWSLIVQQLASNLFAVIVLWFVVKWRPKWIFSMKSFRELFGFGSKLLASGLLNTVFNNLYTLVIGKFFTPAQLGYYSKANTMGNFPSSNLTGVIQSVTFPVLSSIQNEEERLILYYRQFIRLSAFIIFPIMIGLAAVADPLVRVLLTDKWADMIIFLQLLCLSQMWYPVHSINLNVLQVKGRSDYFLKLEIIKKILVVIVLCITIPYGLVAMCIGSIFTSVVSLAINTYYTEKIIGYGFLEQMKDLAPTIITSFVMGAIVFSIVNIVPNIYVELSVGVIAGIGCYYGIARLFKYEELTTCVRLLKERIH